MEVDTKYPLARGMHGKRDREGEIHMALYNGIYIRYHLVYGLYNPLTNELKYIGMTSNKLESRLSGHIIGARNLSNRNSELAKWINDLGGKIEIRMLFSYDNHKDARIAEQVLINEYREQLFNIVVSKNVKANRRD